LTQALMLSAWPPAGAKPTPGPAAGTPSDVALLGMPATVRGRAGHVVEHRPNAPPWAGYEYSWRALWWIEDNRIVVLASERFAGDPPLVSASELVAVANGLSCLQPAACP